MTEAGWLACSDPDWLLEPTSHIFHVRKTGLWAAACCRRIRHLYPDVLREVVHAAEAIYERSDHLIGKFDRMAILADTLQDAATARTSAGAGSSISSSANRNATRPPIPPLPAVAAFRRLR